MLHILSTPVLYSLELTPYCNNRCPGCYNVFVADKPTRTGPLVRQPLTFNQWRIIFDKLAPHAHRFKLSGGEPSLHPDFEAIVRHIRILNISFTLFTNGRWHNPNGLLDLMSDTPQFTGLLVSLHGASAEHHQVFTGIPGSFEETIDNIRRAVARGLPVATSTVFTQANLDELPAIVDLSLKIGARHVVFNRYLGDATPGISISEADLIRVTQQVDQMKNAGKPVKFGVCVPQCFTPNTSNGCLAGVAYCAVDPWGNVRPCNHSQLIAGNLLDQPIETIWQSAEMDRFRASIPNACHTCAAFAQCHSGCKALAMELGLPHDPLMRQPLSPHEVAPLPILRLNAQMRPLRRFEMREESWGYILMRGNVIVPVRARAREILDALNGATNIAQIKHTFGAEGLSLVGSLYQRGLVDLQI